MYRINLTPRPSFIYLILLLTSHGIALLVLVQTHWFLAVKFGGAISTVFLWLTAITVLVSLASTLRDWAGLSKQTVVRFEADDKRWLLWFPDGSCTEAQLAGGVLVWRYLVIAKLRATTADYWLIAFRDSLSAESHRRVRAFLNIYGLHPTPPQDD